MSAFCSKYPGCGCKDVGTKCYDDDADLKSKQQEKINEYGSLTIENKRFLQTSGGCDLAPKKVEPPKELTEEERTAAEMGITVGRLQAARKYANLLVHQARARKEKIKESTVRAKVAKKFNIKLV